MASEFAAKPSRRSFLGIASGLAIGVGASSLVAACSSAAPASPTAAPSSSAAPASSSAAQPTAATQPTAAASQPVAAAGPTKPAASPAAQGSATAFTINHWSWLTASDGVGWQKMIDNFNAANKDQGVQIDMTVVPDDQYGTKVLASSATGQAPDFGWDDASTRWDWYQKGVIIPLDDYLKAAGLDFTDFQDWALQAARYNGKLGGMPMDLMTLCMLINTDHAKAAGLDVSKPPSTGDELLTWADKLSQRSGDKVTRSGFLLTGSGLQPATVWGMVAPMMGNERVGEDGKSVMTNQSAAHDAAQWVLDCFDKLKVSSRDIADRYKAFGAGQASMFWTGPWTLSGYRGTQGLNFMVAPIPTVGKRQATYFELGCLEMFKQDDQTRYPKTAQALKWLSDNGELWNTSYRGAAVRKSILNKPDYKTSGIPWEYRGPFTDAASYAIIREVPIAPYLDFEIYTGSGLIPKSLDPVWQKQTSIDAGLAKLKQQWQQDVDDAASQGIHLSGPYY